MTIRAFFILSLITAVVVIAAVVSVSQREQPETAVVATGKVLPMLGDRLSEVDAVSLTAADAALMIRRDGDIWALEERGGYPVPTENVRTLAVDLANLDKIEGKTERPDRYAALGVEDVDAEGAESKKVTLLNSDGEVVAELLVGNRTTNGNEVFVRIPGDERAWMARGPLDVDMDPRGWVNRSVVDIPAADVRRVAVVHSDGGETLTIEKASADEASFSLRELPEGAAVTDSGVLPRMAAAFAGLDLEDVQPAETLTLSDDPQQSVRLSTFDGVTIDADLYRIDGDVWVTIVAGVEVDSGESVVEVVREINERTDGWIYKIPSWKAAPLENRLADLVEVSTPNEDE
jgi:hypothetical protein